MRPAPPNRLRQAWKAAWYWLGMVRRGVELGADPFDPGAEVVEPAKREPVPRPKPAVATLAGTPWVSRHCVSRARTAAKLPPAAAMVVEVVEADDLAELPPHPAARPARASITPIRASGVRRRGPLSDALGTAETTADPD